MNLEWEIPDFFDLSSLEEGEITSHCTTMAETEMKLARPDQSGESISYFKTPFFLNCHSERSEESRNFEYLRPFPPLRVTEKSGFAMACSKGLTRKVIIVFAKSSFLLLPLPPPGGEG